MSAAYYLAFSDLRRRMRDGELHPDDLVFTVDADGQHDLDVIDDLHRRTVEEKLDALLVRRDLSTYPPYKQAGNGLLLGMGNAVGEGTVSTTSSSGYRIFRLGAMADALDVLPRVQVLGDGRSRGRCCAGSATVCATTCSFRCRCIAAVRAWWTCSSILLRFRRPHSVSRRGGRRAKRCRASRHRWPSRAAAAVVGLAIVRGAVTPRSALLEVARQSEQLVEPDRLETLRP